MTKKQTKCKYFLLTSWTSYMWRLPLGDVLGEGAVAGKRFSIFAPKQIDITFRLTVVVMHKNCAIQFNAGALGFPHMCLSATGHKSQASATNRFCM